MAFGDLPEGMVRDVTAALRVSSDRRAESHVCPMRDGRRDHRTILSQHFPFRRAPPRFHATGQVLLNS
jgi:hypothetical protein